jgi:hypothetical protein
LLRARERILNIGADIFFADVLMKFRTLHETCRLLAGTAQQQRPTRVRKPIREVFERLQT